MCSCSVSAKRFFFVVGLVLQPTQLNKWLVLFCDEINLPDMDKYGTQRVISFLRQMVCDAKLFLLIFRKNQ